MEACEFVRKFGLFTSKEYLAGSTIYDNHLMVFTNDCELNRLVESHELVKRFGGLENSKIELESTDYNSERDFYESLKQAIVDVESCQ